MRTRLTGTPRGWGRLPGATRIWLPGFALLLVAGAPRAETPTRLTLAGDARFTVPVNVRAFTIHGKATGLAGSLVLSSSGNGFVLRDVDLRMPVTALRTGMRLRDKHMRERIFETEAGDMPDVVFASERSTCRRVEDAARCRLIGTLSIRGIARPLSAEAFVTRNGPGYRAEAEARVLLSDYGIERPRQFGVVAADSIVLRVELTAIPHPAEERAPSGR